MTFDANPHGLQAVVDDALARFHAAMEAAGMPVPKGVIEVEVRAAPHQAPTSLPSGRMAVYAFFHQGCCLKCGKVGRKSLARYTSQHYNPRSARSTLARSLLESTGILPPSVDEASIGQWMRHNADRVNLLLDATLGNNLLSLLEAFLHVLWDPRFEGHQ